MVVPWIWDDGRAGVFFLWKEMNQGCASFGVRGHIGVFERRLAVSSISAMVDYTLGDAFS